MALVANPLRLAPVTATEVCYVSPVFHVPQSSPQSSPQAAPSQRTRSRRSNRSSSDEHSIVSWDKFSEEDLRAGGPNLCDGPCETFYGIPRHHPYYNALNRLDLGWLEKELLDLARGISPEITEVRFCTRKSRMDKDEHPSLTVLFTARRQVLTARGWIDTARKVRQRLHQKGFPQVKVEIVDLRFNQPLRPFPCLPTDDIYPIWVDVTKVILRTLDLSDVYTMACFRIGGDTRETSAPTIVMGINGKSARNWTDLRETLVRTLDNLRLPTVGILLRRDRPIHTIDPAAMSISTRATPNCTPEINAGYGLCPHLQEAARGTFGCWVELKNPSTGAWVPFGLTCTHCILPLDNGLTEHQKPVVKRWRRNGVPFADTKAAEMLLMDSPPRSDLKSGIQTITTEIEGLRQDELYRKVTKAHADNEYVMPPEERRWQNIHSSIVKYENEQKLLEKYLEKDRCTFGCVMAASGLKEKPLKSVQAKDPQEVPSILDWALIRPIKHPNRTVGTNEIAYATSSRNGPRSLADFEVRELQVNKQLGKVGYITGFTRGNYSGLRAVLIATRIVNGKEETYGAWEHVVTCGPREIPIVEHGDSGSPVFDDTGAVVGMCFGGTDTGDALYFTHIGDLLESIQEVTGVHDIRLRT